MSMSNTRLSYDDCFELWDKAKEAKGIRIKYASLEEAERTRARLHYARIIDRKDNEKMYTPNEPLHGRSVYDPFMIQIRQDTEDFYWVYIKPVSSDVLEIEELQNE